jgi:hypothetical protein
MATLTSLAIATVPLLTTVRCPMNKLSAVPARYSPVLSGLRARQNVGDLHVRQGHRAKHDEIGRVIPRWR